MEVTLNNPWALYDSLIEGVDPSLVVDHYTLGLDWTEVWSGPFTGVAMTVKDNRMGGLQTGSLIGQSLKDVAALIKSWNFSEASLGAAALNCFYNSIEKVQTLGGFTGINLNDLNAESRQRKNALIAFQNEIRGKKVAMIGHFPDIERQFMGLCELTILERNPQQGDYPDPACEYLIPDQDYLFITGMTLTNKTLPRLLELAKDKVKVSMLGPSVCMAPQLFNLGVDNLSGYCVTDRDLVDEAIRRGDTFAIFDAGVMVSVDK
jgi:uncharacterized protein (DUF4213/DUF364 family)